MQCSHTGEIPVIPGQSPAVHIDDDVIALALALTPYVRTLQTVSDGGNGNIILPFRGGVLESIKLELQSKLRKLIRLSNKQA